MNLVLFLLTLIASAQAEIGIVCDNNVDEKYLLKLDLQNHSGSVFKYNFEDNAYREMAGKVIVNPNRDNAIVRVIHTPEIKVDWKEGECFRFVAPIIQIDVKGDKSTIWKRAQVVINPEVNGCSYPRVEPGPRLTLQCTNP